MAPPLIALLTDYGHQDAYVGVLKAVIWDLCSVATILDLCHEVPPQNLLSGAYLLATAVPYLPKGTIVVAVVDPEVGSERRAIGVQTARLTLLGPDNGLFTLALKQEPPCLAVALDNPRYHLPQVSPTFHGRDLFAPVAAHLANGARLEQVGSPIPLDSLKQLPLPEPVAEAGGITCHILHIDRFGNLITNLTQVRFQHWCGNKSVPLLIRGKPVPIHRTFADVQEGEPVAYFGSGGYLEIAVRNGNAAQRFNLRQGAKIKMRLGESKKRMTTA